MLPAFIASVTSHGDLLAGFWALAENDSNYYKDSSGFFFQGGGHFSPTLQRVTVTIPHPDACTGTGREMCAVVIYEDEGPCKVREL